MSIRFTKIKNGTIIYSQVDNAIVIKSCFDFCTLSIRKGVKWFLDSEKCKRLTLTFEDYKVRLEKL